MYTFHIAEMNSNGRHVFSYHYNAPDAASAAAQWVKRTFVEGAIFSLVGEQLTVTCPATSRFPAKQVHARITAIADNRPR